MGVKRDKALLVFLTIAHNKGIIEKEKYQFREATAGLWAVFEDGFHQPGLRFFETCLLEMAFITCCMQHVMKSPCDILIFPVINIMTSCN